MLNIILLAYADGSAHYDSANNPPTNVCIMLMLKMPILKKSTDGEKMKRLMILIKNINWKDSKFIWMKNVENGQFLQLIVELDITDDKFAWYIQIVIAIGKIFEFNIKVLSFLMSDR